VADRVVLIKVKSDTSEAQGLKQVANQLSNINRRTAQAGKSLDNISRSIQRFTGFFSGLVAGISVREIVEVVDNFQLLEDRIAGLVGSRDKAKEVFTSLTSAAAETRTSVDSLAKTYNRIALATNELGLSEEAIIDVTKALQNTFRISGTTISEANAGVVQLSQGLSAGALRGQELRSVVEQNAVLANLLAKEFGVARGDLIKFAETGQITSERVLKALSKDFIDLDI